MHPRPLTVLAMAILITSPALIRFASGGLSVLGVLLWLLGGVVVSGTGLSIVGAVWSRYSKQGQRER